jgi:hypothetical protein
VGVSSVIIKEVDQRLVFDKGLAASLLVHRMSFRAYVYNLKKEHRYFWLSVRYNIDFKIATPKT